MPKFIELPLPTRPPTPQGRMFVNVDHLISYAPSWGSRGSFVAVVGNTTNIETTLTVEEISAKLRSLAAVA